MTEESEEESEEQVEQDMSIETVAKYWSHRGFVGKELAYRIQETIALGELIDDSNDACKVCE